jgi:hypothetical protein
LTQNKAKLCKILIIILVFGANFFAENGRKSQKMGENRRKWAKIAENCDHNIDPRATRVVYIFFKIDLDFRFQASWPRAWVAWHWQDPEGGRHEVAGVAP